MEAWLFLFLVFLAAFFGKNNSLIIACIVVAVIKLLPFADKWFYVLQAKGINWGVTIISIAILVPIATGKITLQDMFKAFKTPAGWIAVASGILVAVLSRYGISQLAAVPQVTVMLVIGTILGVVFLKGVAAGPVIASGMAYVIISLLGLSFK